MPVTTLLPAALPKPAPLLCWAKEDDADKFGLNDDDAGDELWLAAFTADEDKGCWDEGLLLLLLLLPLLVLVLVWLLLVLVMLLLLVLTLAAPLLLFVVADAGAAPSVNVLIHCGPNFITAPDMVKLVD